MIRNQGPGVALCLGFFEDVGEPFKERLPIFIVKEDLSSFYSPGHDVLEKAGGVKSWLAGHGVLYLNVARELSPWFKKAVVTVGYKRLGC